MGTVDSFGLLYGHRRRLDVVLPSLPNPASKFKARKQFFGRPIPVNQVDSFGRLYGNRRRLVSVLPSSSCDSNILTLRPPRASTCSSSLPERSGSQLSSRWKGFVAGVRKMLSGPPKRQELPGKVPCVARRSAELGMETPVLSSKVPSVSTPCVSMPSDKLVVVQILQRNFCQQDDGSKPSPLGKRFQTLPSSPRSAVLPTIKQPRFNTKSFNSHRSATLEEYQAQGLETIDAVNKPSEVAGEANPIDTSNPGTSDEHKGEGKVCSTCSGSSASSENSTTRQINGEGTAKDSEQDGKPFSDSTKSDDSSDKENAAHRINDADTANKIEGKVKDRRDSSIPDVLLDRDTAHQIEDSLAAQNHVREREDRTNRSPSNVLSNEGNTHRADNDATADNGEGDESEGSNSSTTSTTSSETASDSESDGGVLIDDFDENSDSSLLSGETSAKDEGQEDDDNAVDRRGNESCGSSECSASDYVSADESNQTDDASDEEEVDAKGNRALKGQKVDLGSWFSEQDDQPGIETGPAALVEKQDPVDVKNGLDNGMSGSLRSSTVSTATEKRRLP